MSKKKKVIITLGICALSILILWLSVIFEFYDGHVFMRIADNKYKVLYGQDYKGMVLSFEKNNTVEVDGYVFSYELTDDDSLASVGYKEDVPSHLVDFVSSGIEAIKTNAPLSYLIKALGLLVGGLLCLCTPYLVFYLLHGWKYKNVEPSDAFYTVTKIAGIICVIVSVGHLLYFLF